MLKSKEGIQLKTTLAAFFLLISIAIGKASDNQDLESDSMVRSFSYTVESQATFSSGEYTPFWIVSNIQGLGGPKKNNGWVRGRIQKDMNPLSKFSWGAGIDILGKWNLPAPFNVHQLYGEVKYREFFVMAGAKEIWGSYNNPILSSGNLLFSGNAMPIPQVRIGTYGFAPFWGTKKWFSVNAYLAYGKFTDSNWEKSWVNPKFLRTANVLFCSRGLWLRGGNIERFPLLVDVGIEMGTQFGGIIYDSGKVIDMPTKFIDWIKAIIPLPGSSETPVSEQTNVQGNMVGAYNIALQWIPNSDWSIKGYFEHYFEDHSQMTFEYGWKDGQWGIEVNLPHNPFISNVVAEFIYTKDQTGPVNHDWTPEIPEQVSGADNYYNHHLYGSWQNWGMTIGTPLAISPLYNSDHRLFIYNTRFIAYHLGLEGNPMNNFSWRALFTFTKNWGTYYYPLPDIYNNFSGLVEVNYSFEKKLKGWWGKAAIAWDAGKLLGNNFGVMISIGKTGLIKW